ncbi:peptidylprolyl isomerase [Lysobacter solisilvae (ex Woo and Kim 2020)]|uniref:Chaperone SurA n=1 Tax=Agrilutibacter terrestris TaxID=2865112 RepID=A0A7H0FYX3_9GAMM|nr:peptidylprolyl isomerase [Lysobacter terrestris]QNP41239.1 peptidylprolyl isomerase [Lysobacter terrestris]
MKKFLACLLAAAALSGATAFAQQQAAGLQPIDRIAAVVDEDVVLRSELDRAVANITRQYAGRESQLPPRDVLERQVLERLVLMKLQLARAEQTGVRVTDQEVDASIAGLAQQNKLSMEQLRQQAVADGGTFADFRNSIRDELVVQRLRQRFAQSRIAVSDAEIESALAAQKNAGAQYHLAHIMVALPEGATAEQIKTARSKIEGVQGLIDRREVDFAAAAVRYSDSPNALEGGDLGWRSLDEIPAAFATLVKGMKAGDVSAPLRGASGFQLLKLVEVRDESQAASANTITQVHARHILVRMSDTTTEAAAKAKIDTIAARIKGGADFAEVARQESQDLNSQAKGGDLGWFVPEQYGSDFGIQVASLSDGQVSAPFRTDAGWHVVQRLATRQTNTDEENRRARISDTIGRRKLEDEWNRFLQEMRGEAYFVDMRNGLPVEAPAAEAKPKG